MVQSVLQKWISALSSEISKECKIGRDLGHGFFQVIMKEETAMQKVLMLMPHLSKWGTYIMQPWMSAFDASKPQGTRMQTGSSGNQKCPGGIPEQRIRTGE